MSYIFDLEHVFIVFPAGGSGNFIAGLVAKLLSKDFSNLTFSFSGNFHKGVSQVPPSGDPFHCGLLYGLPKFNTVKEKIFFYRNAIEEKYTGEYNTPLVGWTHDFTNIEVYKNIFPNCKILAITQESDEEKLAVLIQQELKNRLDPAGFVFVDDTRYLKIWKIISSFFLNAMLGNKYNSVIGEMLDNKFDPQYDSLVAYTTIYNMIRFFKFEHVITNSLQRTNYLDYNLYYKMHDPKFNFAIPAQDQFEIGPSYKDCITPDCITLPYCCIMKNDADTLINTLEILVGTPINVVENQFLKSNFDNYFKKQNQTLMDNPLMFFKNLENKAMKQVADIKKQPILV